MTSERTPSGSGATANESAQKDNSVSQERSPIAPGRWLLPAVAIGITLAPLNSTMIAVALPEIQAAFGVSITATTWLVTIYLVAMAAGHPVGGRLGDLYGRRRVYLLGLTWFAVASIGCAFAPNLVWLIVFRTMQALAGTLSFPNGAAMLREAMPEAQRGAAFGMVGMATGIAAASGPPLGGILVHLFGWSAIFWANVPVVAAAVFMGWRGLPRWTVQPAIRARFDILGTILFTAALALAILVPTLLKFEDRTIALIAGAAAAAVGWTFVKWERRTRSPVVDVRLFARPHYAAACAAVGFGNFVMYTTLLALPLYLHAVLNRGIQEIGFILVALSAFSAFSGPLGGRWSDRSGRWMPAVSGSTAILAGALLLTIGVVGASVTLIVFALAIMGIGVGVSGAPVQTVAVESVPLANAGSAAGVFSTSRYMGSVVGSSLLAAFFARETGAETSDRFALLFAGLSIAAVALVVASSRIADRGSVGSIQTRIVKEEAR